MLQLMARDDDAAEAENGDQSATQGSGEFSAYGISSSGPNSTPSSAPSSGPHFVGIDSSCGSSLGTRYEPSSLSNSTLNHSSQSDGEENATPAVPEQPKHSSQEFTASIDSPILSTPQVPFVRPSRRPPIAFLRVYDDNMRTFEEVRIRVTIFEIGRRQGQLVIEHDSQISSRHLRIRRVCREESCKWLLEDLNSMNGIFLKKDRINLTNDTWMLIGGDLVRFKQSSPGGEASLAREDAVALHSSVTLHPHRVNFIGTSAQHCLDFMRNHPYLDPHHIRLECNSAGSWTIQDIGSTNGIWQQVKNAVLEDGTHFQAGEQRFGFFLG